MAEEKIRVIIVDDIAETRENIRKLLQFESDVEVVGVAGVAVPVRDQHLGGPEGVEAVEVDQRLERRDQLVVGSLQGRDDLLEVGAIVERRAVGALVGLALPGVDPVRTEIGERRLVHVATAVGEVATQKLLLDRFDVDEQTLADLA